MNDTDRIKRLAEWMGISYDEGYHWWNPLERIQDAWMLVEKARELSYRFRTSLGWTWGIQGEWQAGFDKRINDETNQWWGYGVTAPLAICAAIEKVMEAKCKP